MNKWHKIEVSYRFFNTILRRLQLLDRHIYGPTVMEYVARRPKQ